MKYPLALIKAYNTHEINRAEFCRRYAAIQGYNGLRGYANASGVYVEYRKRHAKIDGGVITWWENEQQYTARSYKEFKIKIDILETRVYALMLKACYWANAAYEASRRAEYEKREQYQHEQLKILEVLKRILNY